jgi:hypothetical protein
MTRDDIIFMAREAGLHFYVSDLNEELYVNIVERFAALVAKHTMLNIDPSKLMSHQEGFEAGQLSEREACAKWADLVAREIDNTNNTANYIASGIRARGEK